MTSNPKGLPYKRSQMKNSQPKKRIRLKGFDYSGRFRYFLTFCTKDKAAYFNDAALVSGVADFLRETAEQHKFKIWSFCFMPDHLHVLVEGMHAASDFRKFVSSFKQRSGYWFRHSIDKVGQGFSPADQASLKACPTEDRKDGSVVVGQGFSPAMLQREYLWQVNYYEHVLRNDETTQKIGRYILDNPVRKGLVKDFRDYPFSICDIHGFVGQGFSPAEQASLKACPTEDRKDGGVVVGQGFSPAENQCNDAPLKGCPVKAKSSELCNPEGLPYKSKSSGLHNPKPKGFTLVEIVITIVLIGILSGLAAMIILQGVRGYSDEQSRSDVHYQARFAMERMTREIRALRSATAADIPTMTATALQFNDINGANIQFQRSGASAPYTILRNADTLATNVQSVTFSYFANDGITVVTPATVANLWFVGITVTATAPNGETLDMRTRVHPRNF